MKLQTLRQAIAANRLANSRYFRRWKQLDREARADRCKGDICSGWDWPTLRAVKPEAFVFLQAQIQLAKQSTTRIHALFQLAA